MELLLQAIEKKLANVDSERKRWLEYKTEHEQAGDNLREFPKSFRKEILVPIGSKALIPGHLYHTNEIFVSMYNGLFAKCSADTALSVCEHRINEANKRIDALNVEHKMYRDRLELPADENVFGDLSSGAQEIIEEYNEEDEQKWREQHKIRVREYKQAEAEERKRQFAESDVDIEAILENAELMEELENELEQLNVNCDEHLQQHLRNGENGIELVQHEQQNTNNVHGNEANDDEIDSEEFRSLSATATSLSTDDRIKFYEIHLQKIREYFTNNARTIQNANEFIEKRVTQECLENAIEELQEASNDANTTIATQPSAAKKAEVQQECVQNVQNPYEPRKFHSPSDFDEIEREYAAKNKSKSELLVFYKGQLSQIVKLIAGCTASNVHTREQKRVLYEFLSDRISSLREEIQKEKQIKLEEDFVDDDDDIDVNMKQSCRKLNVISVPFGLDDLDRDDDEHSNSDGKRKINFAPQPSVVTFFEDDEPCVVSQQNESSLADATFEFFNSPSNSSASSVCDDVDDDDDDEDNKNVSNASDNINAENLVPHSDLLNNLLKRQTHYRNDCDINIQMNQSNECTINNQGEGSCSSIATEQAPNQNTPKTLILQFSHSTNTCTATVSTDDDVINSPLDIYRKFGSPVTETATNRPTVSASLNTINRTCQLNVSTNDPNSSVSSIDVKALEVPNINQKPSKSILKKKDLVDQEIRAPIIDEADPLDEHSQCDEFPKFTQVLGEIVEHSDANESNITPQSNDIHAPGQPKKRESLFKKSRKS